eukprot:899270-Pelagomonas_calceolata.AAC.3
MALASQKEHAGGGKACMRALQGAKGVSLQAMLPTCLHVQSCVYNSYSSLFSCLFEHEKADNGAASPEGLS